MLMDYGSAAPLRATVSLPGLAPYGHRGAEPAPQEVFHALWQRRWTVFVTVIVCLGAGAGYLRVANPVYTAAATLYVVPDLPEAVGQLGWRERSKNYLNTQCELLTSTAILGPLSDVPELRGMKTFEGAASIPSALKEQLAVEVGNKDDLIELSLDSTDAAEAARIVNAVVDSYVAYQASQKRTSASEMLKILRKERDAREHELAERRQAVLSFKQRNTLLSLQNDGGGIVMQRLAQLSEARTAAELNVMEAAAAYESVRATLADPIRGREVAAAMAVDTSETAAGRGRVDLQNELRQLQVKLAAMQRHLAPGHPSVDALAESIAETERRLGDLDMEFAAARLAALQQSWVTAKERYKSVDEAFEGQQRKALELNATSAKLAVLESAAEQAQRTVEGLDARIKELGVGGEIGALNVTVLESAVAADKPSKPRKSLVLVASGLLGLIGGSLLAFVRASTDKRLRSSEQVEEVLGIPVLSAVPHIKRRRMLAARKADTGAIGDPEAADAYRTIRAAIHFGTRGHSVKTLVVTSAVQGEGKSTLAANLAISMAQAGEQTLLVDADLRRPTLHRRFNLAAASGVSTVVNGVGDVCDVVCATGIKGLDLLPSGPVPPNPSELLSSGAFEALLASLAGRYDRIVLDAPPVLGMPDALILGARSDKTLLVVRAGISDRRATQAALAALANVGVRSLATVVNGVRGRNGYSQYGRGYYAEIAQADFPAAGQAGAGGATSVDVTRGQVASADGPVVAPRQQLVVARAGGPAAVAVTGRR